MSRNMTWKNDGVETPPPSDNEEDYEPCSKSLKLFSNTTINYGDSTVSKKRIGKLSIPNQVGAGIPGARSKKLLNQLDGVIMAHEELHGKWVLWLGSTDLSPEKVPPVPLEDSFVNWSTILIKLREELIGVVAAINRGDVDTAATETLNAKMEKFCNDLDIPFFKWHANDVVSDKDIYHPQNYSMKNMIQRINEYKNKNSEKPKKTLKRKRNKTQK